MGMDVSESIPDIRVKDLNFLTSDSEALMVGGLNNGVVS